MNRRAPRRSLLLLVLCPLLLAQGCGEQGGSSGAGATSGPPGRHLRVGLTEWTILTSAPVVAAGRLRLTVTNTGATEHDLVVRGHGGQWATPVLDPGERTSLTVEARPGERLMLWCAEPGHRAQGMQTTLKVGDDAPPGRGQAGSSPAR